MNLDRWYYYNHYSLHKSIFDPLDTVTLANKLNEGNENSSSISQKFLSEAGLQLSIYIPLNSLVTQFYHSLQDITIGITLTLTSTIRISASIMSIITNSIAWLMWTLSLSLFCIISNTNHNVTWSCFQDFNFERIWGWVWNTLIEEKVCPFSGWTGLGNLVYSDREICGKWVR